MSALERVPFLRPTVYLAMTRLTSLFGFLLYFFSFSARVASIKFECAQSSPARNPDAIQVASMSFSGVHPRAPLLLYVL